MLARAFEQMSRSGTPNRNGISRPDDYVVELTDPVRRMAIFEEMRASDDGVQSAVDTREKLILASTWKLVAPDDTPTMRTITEFCEDNVYPFLDDCLRWLGGGALQYGFGMIEPVFAWSDTPVVRTIIRGGKSFPTRKYGRKIYLSKLAHIRQRTIQTFGLDEKTGALLYARQYAWNGFQFRQVDIPADKLLMWTYNRQGDDYWGVPPMRNIYKAWTFKNELERLNILGIDRFGTGTPVAEAGPGWGDADFERMDTYLANWRSGENTFLVHPAGGKISILTAAGQMTIATLDWVKYYNLAITKAYYTQGSELGSTETGARAVGDTMLAVLETVSQADNEALASIINERLIVPLVIMNYGEQDAYPRFEPSQRVRATQEFGSLITSLIGSKVITWRPEDEAWLRDVAKMPAVSVDELKKLADERAAQALAIAATVAGVKPGDPNAPPNPKMPAQSPTAANRFKGLSLARPSAAPEPASSGETWRTHEFSDFESQIVKPGILMRDLDLETSRATAELTDALSSVDAALAAEVRDAAAGGSEALSAAVRSIQVPPGVRAKLRKTLMQAAERAQAMGEDAVFSETLRLKALVDPSVPSPVGRSAWDSVFGYLRGKNEADPPRRDATSDVAEAIRLQSHSIAKLAARETPAPEITIEKGAFELHVHNEAGKTGERTISIERADGSKVNAKVRDE